MRKRQWKKVLSVVLALAMVFSMNISAFAEPIGNDGNTGTEIGSDNPDGSVQETPEETNTNDGTETPENTDEKTPEETPNSL